MCNKVFDLCIFSHGGSMTPWNHHFIVQTEQLVLPEMMFVY